MVLWNGITESRWQNAQQEYSVSAIIRHGLGSQMPIPWIFSKLPSKPESRGEDEPHCSESRSGLRMFTAWTLTTSSSSLSAASRCLLHILLVWEPFPSARALPGQGLRLSGSLNPKCLAQCIGDMRESQSLASPSQLNAFQPSLPSLRACSTSNFPDLCYQPPLLLRVFLPGPWEAMVGKLLILLGPFLLCLLLLSPMPALLIWGHSSDFRPFSLTCVFKKVDSFPNVN